VEKTALEMADAVIAVSEETKKDVLRLFNVDPKRIEIIYNGIDLAEYKKVETTTALQKFGIDPQQPFVLFVGRITRQKGIVHLVNAIKHLDPGFQVVLCAGAPDTPEIAQEMKAAVATAQQTREGVIWIEEMVQKSTVYELYSHAAVFCCPSIYEPFGIINLEAMACETAVVASAVGGIKEVVVDGETGFLVPVEQMQESPFEPLQPQQFSRDLAAKINLLMADPEMRARFGQAGRRRAEEKFSWSAIAQQTADLYRSIAPASR
jgi:starch synthase